MGTTKSWPIGRAQPLDSWFWKNRSWNRLGVPEHFKPNPICVTKTTIHYYMIFCFLVHMLNAIPKQNKCVKNNIIDCAWVSILEPPKFPNLLLHLWRFVDRRLLLEVCYCTVPAENMMLAAQAMSTIAFRHNLINNCFDFSPILFDLFGHAVISKSWFSYVTISVKAAQMMNGVDEEPAVANFAYYKPILTGASNDRAMKKELDALIAKFTFHEKWMPETWLQILCVGVSHATARQSQIFRTILVSGRNKKNLSISYTIWIHMIILGRSVIACASPHGLLCGIEINLKTLAAVETQKGKLKRCCAGAMLKGPTLQHYLLWTVAKKLWWSQVPTNMFWVSIRI